MFILYLGFKKKVISKTFNLAIYMQKQFKITTGCKFHQNEFPKTVVLSKKKQCLLVDGHKANLAEGSQIWLPVCPIENN